MALTCFFPCLPTSFRTGRKEHVHSKPAATPQPTEAEAELAVQRRTEGLARLRKTLRENSYVAVDSETMMEWLNTDVLKSHGTTLDKVQPDFGQLWAEAPTQRSEGSSVIYKHKKVFHSSYSLPDGLGDNTPIQQTSGILCDGDGTLRQKYIAHDTTSTQGKATEHYTRFYPALPEKWRGHPVMAALHRLFAEIAAQPSQNEMDIRPPTGCNLFQFCYRTVQTAEAGDPGPEGTHVDGATVAMLVVMRRDNLKPQTGGTRIWSSEQPTGKPTQEDLESEKLLYTWKPGQKFDTLFFLDENVKHEALQGELIDPSSEGLRDMFIMDCRRQDGAWCARKDQGCGARGPAAGGA